MAEVTDLGIIRVQSDGAADVVTLAHNDMTAFAVRTVDPVTVQITFNPKLSQYPDHQWKELFAVYVHWKRQKMPGMLAPPFSGKTVRRHPWQRGRFK